MAPRCLPPPAALAPPLGTAVTEPWTGPWPFLSCAEITAPAEVLNVSPQPSPVEGLTQAPECFYHFKVPRACRAMHVCENLLLHPSGHHLLPPFLPVAGSSHARWRSPSISRKDVNLWRFSSPPSTTLLPFLAPLPQVMPRGSQRAL